MNQVIIEVLEFVNHGVTSGPALSAAVAVIDPLQFQIVAINLLAWLKSQKRTKKLFPLPLKPEDRWAKNLCILISREGFLNDFLSVSDVSVFICTDLPKQEVDETLDFVDANYQPRMMVDPRRTNGIE